MAKYDLEKSGCKGFICLNKGVVIPEFSPLSYAINHLLHLLSEIWILEQSIMKKRGRALIPWLQLSCAIYIYWASGCRKTKSPFNILQRLWVYKWAWAVRAEKWGSDAKRFLCHFTALSDLRPPVGSWPDNFTPFSATVIMMLKSSPLVYSCYHTFFVNSGEELEDLWGFQPWADRMCNCLIVKLSKVGMPSVAGHLQEDVQCCPSLVIGADPEPGACLCSTGGFIEDWPNAAAFGSELSGSPPIWGVRPAVFQHTESISSMVFCIFPVPLIVLLYPHSQSGTRGQKGRAGLWQWQWEAMETEWVTHDAPVRSRGCYLNYLSSLLEYFWNKSYHVF